MSKFYRFREAAKKTVGRHSFLIKLLISVSLLVYCSRLVDFGQLSRFKINGHWILCAWILILIDYAVGALRFKALSDWIIDLKLSAHVKYYFWSGFFNAALPSSIGGDAMRMIWLSNDGLNARTAVSLVFVERLVGVFTLILIAGFAASLIDVPPALQKVMTELWLWAGAGLLGSFLLVLITRKSHQIQQILKTIRKVFVEIGMAQCSAILILSLLYQIITVAITICVAKSIGLELYTPIWFFIVPLVWLLTVIPISVGGLGVREVGFVFLLGAFGQFAEQAVALGLLSFLVYLVGGLVGGAWYLYEGKAAGRK